MTGDDVVCRRWPTGHSTLRKIGPPNRHTIRSVLLTAAVAGTLLLTHVGTVAGAHSPGLQANADRDVPDRMGAPPDAPTCDTTTTLGDRLVPIGRLAAPLHGDPC